MQMEDILDAICLCTRSQSSFTFTCSLKQVVFFFVEEILQCAVRQHSFFLIKLIKLRRHLQIIIILLLCFL